MGRSKNVNCYLTIILFFLSTTCCFGGTISDTLTDWDGDTITGVSFYVQAYRLTGSGVTTRPDLYTAVANTTSNSGTGIFTLSSGNISPGAWYLVYFQCSDTYRGITNFMDAAFMQAQ